MSAASGSASAIFSVFISSLDRKRESLIDSMLTAIVALQEVERHLQDICFLQLGIRLLELWSQKTLELDAAVNTISEHLLHPWLSQLQMKTEKHQESVLQISQ